MLATALLLVLPAAAPSALVFTNASGFSDADAANVQARALDEVAATGLVPVRRTVEIKSECIVDAPCARALLNGAAASWLVSVDVLRAGSRATVAARLLDATGAIVDEQVTVVPVDKLLRGGTPLLPAATTARLEDAARRAATTAAPTSSTAPPPTTTAPSTTTASPAPDGDTSPAPSALVGLGVAALGAALIVGGGAVALGQNAIRVDPSADGDAREATAVTIPASLSVLAIGIAGLAVGVGVLALAGDVDEAPAPGG